MKRNRNRINTSPSRKRPYASMSSNDKAIAYGECGREIKRIKRQYSRLIRRLESKKRLLSFGENTNARSIVVRAVDYIKKI